MPYILATVGALEAEGAGSAAVSIDFTDMLTTALNSISADFGKYAMVAGGIGLVIWGAPKALKLVMKFFNALTRG